MLSRYDEYDELDICDMRIILRIYYGKYMNVAEWNDENDMVLWNVAIWWMVELDGMMIAIWLLFSLNDMLECLDD